MGEIECERSEVQRFCCKRISLRRYGSFNGLIELRNLELLTSEKTGETDPQIEQPFKVATTMH